MAKKDTGCFILILILIPLLLLAAGGWYAMKQYRKMQDKITAEIKAIPPFSQDTATKEAAEELKCSFPAKEPTMTLEQVAEAANKELKEIARKNVLLANFSLQTQDIIKKYRMAKEGDQVSFILNTTGKRVTGTYQGTFTDWKGKLVKVDQQKYRIYDIGLESHYYFDEVISKRRAAEEIAALKKNFDEKRQKVMTENKEKVLKKYYAEAGYTRHGDSWQPNTEVFADLLKQKENRYQQDRERTIKQIFEDNKLFGLITVTLDDDEEKEVND